MLKKRLNKLLSLLRAYEYKCKDELLNNDNNSNSDYLKKIQNMFKIQPSFVYYRFCFKYSVIEISKTLM